MPKPTRSADEAPRCPAWCERKHAATDHSDDRYHRGRVFVVPGVASDGEPVEFIVYVMSDGLSEPSLIVEEGERPRRVTLTVSTAPKILAAAHAAIESVTGPPQGQRRGTNE